MNTQGKIVKMQTQHSESSSRYTKYSLDFKVTQFGTDNLKGL